MNIIRILSQAIFSAISPAGIATPPAGQVTIGISDVTKRLFSVDENGVVTTYGATGEYNDFVNDRILTYFLDFLNTSATYPLTFSAVSSGTLTAAGAEYGQNGIVSINKATVANSGGYLISSTNSVRLKGGEYFEAWIKQNYQTNVTARIGFHNAANVNNPTAGAFFEIVGNVARGKCVNGGSSSSTANTYAINLSTWYKMTIKVDATAANVTFKILDNNNTIVFSETLNTNIPTSVTGFGFGATESTRTACTGLLVIDTMRVDL